MTAHRRPTVAAERFLYRRVGPVSLYLGDAYEVLAAMPDGCVDCIVTSPPYWGLVNLTHPCVSAGQIPRCP
jgi:site-specific DNA-methyltransferase (cytosine-N4-specific)